MSITFQHSTSGRGSKKQHHFQAVSNLASLYGGTFICDEADITYLHRVTAWLIETFDLAANVPYQSGDRFTVRGEMRSTHDIHLENGAIRPCQLKGIGLFFQVHVHNSEDAALFKLTWPCESRKS